MRRRQIKYKNVFLLFVAAAAAAAASVFFLNERTCVRVPVLAGFFFSFVFSVPALPPHF